MKSINFSTCKNKQSQVTPSAFQANNQVKMGAHKECVLAKIPENNSLGSF